MKTQTVSPDEVTLSRGDALKAFRRWSSAELLTKQCQWLGAESRRQKRKKADLLREALGLGVRRHPEERLTKARLFNIMREAVGEFIVFTRPCEESRAQRPNDEALHTKEKSTFQTSEKQTSTTMKAGMERGTGFS
jgi:hypothetical protein